MAQISIPMANKVGYSMFWNSMWDGKINFSRLLKEDIYLNMFIPLLFEDKISTKIIKSKDFNNLLKRVDYNRYNLHMKVNNLSKKAFYKYMSELNKVTYFSTKVWILKYQKWIIIFFFMYIPKFNCLKNIKFKPSKKINHNSINNLFTLYKNTTLKLKYSYNFFNKSVNKFHF